MNIVNKILKRLVVDLLVLSLCLVVFTPLTSFHGDFAEADTFTDSSSSSIYPYNKYFTISAYYSPLPCQNRYTTGSYEGDIRLNGSGVNSADNTPVYPGMVAAPKSYSFNTKMYIPGVGTVAIHDRGGAIVTNSGENGVYDRLDIWMGYGDKGLDRALNWGKRNVEVTVYGIDPSITENIFLSDYSPAEAIPNICTYSEPTPAPAPKVVLASEQPHVVNETLQSYLKFNVNLQRGSSGNEVLALQEELGALNFFKGDANGVFGELTEHAVFKFQQSQNIVSDKNSHGAGVFGPATRGRMNEIVTSRDAILDRVVKA